MPVISAELGKGDVNAQRCIAAARVQGVKVSIFRNCDRPGKMRHAPLLLYARIWFSPIESGDEATQGIGASIRHNSSQQTYLLTLQE